MPCFPSLAHAEKNSCGEKLLRLAGEVARRVGGGSHPRIIPQGKQNGHYGRRKGLHVGSTNTFKNRNFFRIENSDTQLL